jgi:hypothetical protein
LYVPAALKVKLDEFWNASISTIGAPTIAGSTFPEK